jgi:sugar lactone lactonase YvrE
VPVSSRQAHEIWKLSPEGKRLRIGGQEAIALENVKELKGLCLTPAGDLAVAVTEPALLATVNEVVGKVAAAGDQYNFSRVDIYGPDGQLKKQGLIRLQGINGVQFDRDGHVYVIDAGTCHGAHKRRAAKLDNQRFSTYDALLKFAPTGGVRDQAGHLWSYRGLSGTSTYTCAGECPAGQLTIDADHRLWLCDAGMYCVAAVDRAGNLMFRVGAYGNEDCRGGGGDRMIPGTQIVQTPEIPLTCPMGTAVWKDDYLLISDMYSHRVVRCKLEYSQQVVQRLTD